MLKKSLTYLLGLSLLIASSTSSFASGFALIEQSVSGLGNAFAGGSAIAEDATTVFFNPAGLTRLEGQQVIGGVHIIVPSAKLKNSSAENSNGNPITGNNGGEAGKIGAAPNLYYANKISEKLAIGFGVNAPFGLATEYGRDWIGRYHAVESDMMTININPSLAYKVNGKLSVGAGINVQYVDATLSSMVDFGNKLTGTSNPATDIFVNNEADGWSHGYNFGLLYEFSQVTRIGFAYRSEVKHKVKGNTTTEVPDAIAAFPIPVGVGVTVPVAALFQNQRVNGKITLPASASLSFFHQLGEKIELMADVSWTEWSSFDELTLNFEGAGIGGKLSTTTPENWEDSWRYSVGMNYNINPAAVLRTGLAYDETPMQDDYRTPRIPGADRYWISVGAGLKINEALNADVAYSHLFVDDSKINLVDPANTSDTGTLTGEYENQVDIASVSLTYRF